MNESITVTFVWFQCYDGKGNLRARTGNYSFYLLENKTDIYKGNTSLSQAEQNQILGKQIKTLNYHNDNKER